MLAVVAAAIASATSASRDTFVLTAAIGGSMWMGLAISALANWQSLTVFDDHLKFISFGRKSTVFYKDVSYINVWENKERKGYAVPMFRLFLHHEGKAESPLDINLRLFAARDRVLLLELLKQNAPNASFSDVVEEVLQKK